MTTCRFEEEHAGKQYPRSCPMCGIAGKCMKGYEQIKLKEGEAAYQGRSYVILDPKGQPDRPYKDNAIPASVLIHNCNRRDREPGGPDLGPSLIHPFPGKPEPYGPVNCNVARRMNGDMPQPTCDRCCSDNGEPTQRGSEAAKGCVFYDHGDFGFTPKPEFVKNPPPKRGALAGDPLVAPEGTAGPWSARPALAPGSVDPWEMARQRAQENREESAAIAALATPRRKLGRVTRALLLDAIEDTLRKAVARPDPVLFPIDKETEQLCEKLLRILDNDD